MTDNSIYISLADRMRHRRDRYLLWPDVVRLVAILLVLAEHAIPYPKGTPAWLTCRILLNGNAQVFFILSGALLLPVAVGGMRDFYHRRIRRVALPFVIWGLVYAVSSQWLKGVNDIQYTRSILWSWAAPYESFLWFIFALIGLYLFMPFISPWLHTASRRSMNAFMLLCVAAWILPYFDLVAFISNQTAMGLHGTWVAPFIGYLGYIVGGVYLERWPMRTWSRPARQLFWVSALVMAVVIPILFYCHNFYYPENRLLPFRVDTLTTAFQSFTVYILASRVRHLPAWLSRIVHRGAALSFGVYLCHILIQRLLVRYCPQWVTDSWLLLVLVIIGSFAMSWLINRWRPVRRLLA